MSSTSKRVKRTHIKDDFLTIMQDVYIKSVCVVQTDDEEYADISMQVMTDDEWNILLTLLNQRNNYRHAEIDPANRTIYLRRLNKKSYIYIGAIEKKYP